ncbi:SixA phosphatase family protein [Echinimonas agarilytica]|uniref:Histidine phosphatase family protein n=1 Tax=Echinimonas agarilytica TaxID=1215918 RepID=A0AA42B726_9GAMM|nr:histidine phosphatase family protein [Echinimonas agarilytica]MCM2679447.1 histidine phosphatase family protein [Echinimonas agarilytica]
MKQLHFIRHAKSSWRHDTDDLLRPLNTRGYRDIKCVSQKAILRDSEPDVIWVSPAVRAYSTAQGLMTELDINPALMQIVPDLYYGTSYRIANLLAHSTDTNIWIVGHNPSLFELIHSLCNGVIDHFPTLAVAHVEWTLNGAKWVGFETPKEYE